jgi:hypothetical protein
VRLAFVLLAACAGHGPPPLNANPAGGMPNIHADQVVSLGDVTYALGAQLAIARGEVVTVLVPVDCNNAPCPAQVWTSAAAMPALDGDGKWIVATRFDKTLWRVRLDGEIERIESRFGLSDSDEVRAVAGAGTTVALLVESAKSYQLAQSLVVTNDDKHVTRFELGVKNNTAIAVAQDRVALANADSIDIWDLAANTKHSYTIGNGRPGFLDADQKSARLVVTTKQGVWIEHGGTLRELGVSDVAATAIAGQKLWLEIGKRLYILNDTTPLDTTVASAGGEPMFGAPNGDVWVGAHGIRRYALGAATIDPSWRDKIQPVFEHVCAHCHLPGGDAGVDLSTAASWTSEHDELVDRVVKTKTMPPAGTEMSDADRATLADFLGAK